MSHFPSPRPVTFPAPGWWAHQNAPDQAWYFDGTIWHPWCLSAGQLSAQPPPASLTDAAHTHLVRCHLSPDDWVRGDLVRHHSFGFGEVIEVRGKDHTAEAIVRFFGVGIKHLSLRWAKLEKVL